MAPLHSGATRPNKIWTHVQAVAPLHSGATRPNKIWTHVQAVAPLHSGATRPNKIWTHVQSKMLSISLHMCSLWHHSTLEQQHPTRSGHMCRLWHHSTLEQQHPTRSGHIIQNQQQLIASELALVGDLYQVIHSRSLTTAGHTFPYITSRIWCLWHANLVPLPHMTHSWGQPYSVCVHCCCFVVFLDHFPPILCLYCFVVGSKIASGNRRSRTGWVGTCSKCF